jgi:hypothetical protein
VAGKPVHSDRLDAIASSPNWPDLKNDEVRCSVSEKVKKRRTVPLALSSTIQVKGLPVFLQTHSRAHVNPPYGSPTAVLTVRLRKRRLNGLKMGRGTTVEYDDDPVGCRPLDLMKYVHHKDVHVGPAKALNWCRGGSGEEFYRGNEHRWMFVREQQGALDANTSSSDPWTLDNEIHCRQREIVSKRRTVLKASFSTQQVADPPVSQDQTRSETRHENSYGPQMAVSSVHQRFLAESCCRHLDDVEGCQNGVLRCSVDETVSKRRTVHPALSSTRQVMNAAVVHARTHTGVRNDRPHGYQTAVVSLHQRFNDEPRRLRLDSSKMNFQILCEHDDGLKRRRWVNPRKNAQCEDIHAGSADASTGGQSKGGGEFHRRNKHRWMFVHEEQGALDVLASSSDPRTLKFVVLRKKRVSKRRTLSSALQVDHSPVSQPPTRPRTRFEVPYGPQVAVSSIPLRSREESYSGHLDGVEPCQNDEGRYAVIENVSKPRTVPLALSPRPQVTDSPVFRDRTPQRCVMTHPTTAKRLYLPTSRISIDGRIVEFLMCRDGVVTSYA